jgi:hypothetical protein
VPNKPGYFDKYYKEKKGEISLARKEKYNTDPEHRDKILQASRDYRELHREDLVRLPRFQKPLVLEAGDGGSVILFSVGAMASYLNRSVQAMNHWERAGILPPTPYKDERGFRYYTNEMMAAVRDVVGNKRRLFPVEPTMRESILKGWREHGVPVKAQSMRSALSATVTKGKRHSTAPGK